MHCRMTDFMKCSDLVGNIIFCVMCFAYGCLFCVFTVRAVRNVHEVDVFAYSFVSLLYENFQSPVL